MINLNKNQTINMDNLKYTVGLGWDLQQNKIDIDVSLFMLNDNNFIPTASHFIFYDNKQSPCNSVIHKGDCRDGSKSNGGNDEEIDIDFSKIDENIKQILIIATIHECKERNLNFGMVRNAYIKISKNNTDICKFSLNDEYTNSSSIIFGKFIKNEESVWTFKALGLGENNELMDYVTTYYQGNVVK